MFQPPSVHQAAGPGREQAGLGVAGSPGLQAAGGGSSCSSCFPLLPRSSPSSSLSPSVPGQVDRDWGFGVRLPREHQAALAPSPSSAPAKQFLHRGMRY